jgi:lipopolysaccharide transport system permease protein
VNSGSALAVRRIESCSPRLSDEVRELWEYRELVGFLVWRDVKVRYTQTTLGIAWAVIQPVVTMVVFSVIFGRIAGLPSEGVPYPLFVLAGALPWQLFSSSLQSASNSPVGSAGLITKVYFPRLIVPLAAVAANLVDFAVSLALLAALMAWYGIAPSAAVIALPFFVLMALAVAFGAGLWASSLNVKYRDVRHALPFVVQVWLFASPVAYSVSLIQSSVWRSLYSMNPMAGVVQGFRWALIGGDAPGIMSLLSVVVTSALLVSGLAYFRATEHAFADVI